MNPKSYYATDGHIVKCAAKGVQQKSDLTYEQYKKVLYGDESVNVKNKCFRVARGAMSTVDIKKVGLSSIFTKGYLSEDKITIRPHHRHAYI